MRSGITIVTTALVLGAALAATPALAQTRQPAPSYSNTGPFSGAPLSPGGISAAASSFGGPGAGYIGPSGGSGAAPVRYSNTGPTGAPLSPGGISAAANAYGGPGYMQTAGSSPNGTSLGGTTSHGRALYAYSSSGAAPAPSYSNTRPSGAPLSPGGISAGASAYGGPGYQGN